MNIHSRGEWVHHYLYVYLYLFNQLNYPYPYSEGSELGGT